MRTAVVVPTLDEEARIGATLRAVAARGRPAALVVADCGSADRTCALARAAGADVVTGPELSCRSAALNAGAARALDGDGALDTLLFLHADALPPDGWDEAIADVLADPRVVGGAFDFAWDYAGTRGLPRGLLAAIEGFNRVRMRVTRCYYGDQGIFVRVDAFARAGGFPARTLLEDAGLCRRLRRLGRLRLARGRTTASPRRFLRHGVARQAMIDAAILAAAAVGLEPARLHAWYNQEKG